MEKEQEDSSTMASRLRSASKRNMEQSTNEYHKKLNKGSKMKNGMRYKGTHSKGSAFKRANGKSSKRRSARYNGSKFGRTEHTMIKRNESASVNSNAKGKTGDQVHTIQRLRCIEIVRALKRLQGECSAAGIPYDVLLEQVIVATDKELYNCRFCPAVFKSLFLLGLHIPLCTNVKKLREKYEETTGCKLRSKSVYPICFLHNPNPDELAVHVAHCAQPAISVDIKEFEVPHYIPPPKQNTPRRRIQLCKALMNNGEILFSRLHGNGNSSSDSAVPVVDSKSCVKKMPLKPCLLDTSMEDRVGEKYSKYITWEAEDGDETEEEDGEMGIIGSIKPTILDDPRREYSCDACKQIFFELEEYGKHIYFTHPDEWRYLLPQEEWQELLNDRNKNRSSKSAREDGEGKEVETGDKGTMINHTFSSEESLGNKQECTTSNSEIELPPNDTLSQEEIKDIFSQMIDTPYGIAELDTPWLAPWIKCSICNETMRSFFDVGFHKLFCKKNKLQRDSVDKKLHGNFLCSSYKTDIPRQQLKGSYYCPCCNECFPLMSSLLIHERTHSFLFKHPSFNEKVDLIPKSPLPKCQGFAAMIDFIRDGDEFDLFTDTSDEDSDSGNSDAKDESGRGERSGDEEDANEIEPPCIEPLNAFSPITLKRLKIDGNLRIPKSRGIKTKKNLFNKKNDDNSDNVKYDYSSTAIIEQHEEVCTLIKPPKMEEYSTQTETDSIKDDDSEDNLFKLSTYFPFLCMGCGALFSSHTLFTEHVEAQHEKTFTRMKYLGFEHGKTEDDALSFFIGPPDTERTKHVRTLCNHFVNFLRDSSRQGSQTALVKKASSIQDTNDSNIPPELRAILSKPIPSNPVCLFSSVVVGFGDNFGIQRCAVLRHNEYIPLPVPSEYLHQRCSDTEQGSSEQTDALAQEIQKEELPPRNKYTSLPLEDYIKVFQAAKMTEVEKLFVAENPFTPPPTSNDEDDSNVGGLRTRSKKFKAKFNKILSEFKEHDHTYLYKLRRNLSGTRKAKKHRQVAISKTTSDKPLPDLMKNNHDTTYRNQGQVTTIQHKVNEHTSETTANNPISDSKDEHPPNVKVVNDTNPLKKASDDLLEESEIKRPKLDTPLNYSQETNDAIENCDTQRKEPDIREADKNSCESHTAVTSLDIALGHNCSSAIFPQNVVHLPSEVNAQSRNEEMSESIPINLISQKSSESINLDTARIYSTMPTTPSISTISSMSSPSISTTTLPTSTTIASSNIHNSSNKMFINIIHSVESNMQTSVDHNIIENQQMSEPFQERKEQNVSSNSVHDETTLSQSSFNAAKLVSDIQQSKLSNDEHEETAPTEQHSLPPILIKLARPFRSTTKAVQSPLTVATSESSKTSSSKNNYQQSPPTQLLK